MDAYRGPWKKNGVPPLRHHAIRSKAGPFSRQGCVRGSWKKNDALHSVIRVSYQAADLRALENLAQTLVAVDAS